MNADFLGFAAAVPGDPAVRRAAARAPHPPGHERRAHLAHRLGASHWSADSTAWRGGPAAEMDWRRYAVAMLVFNVLGVLAVYALQRLQGWLPLNPAGLPGVAPDSALNTAISFVTNTNWQGYAGESTMSYLTQMLALTVQNFVSAATGIAVLIALVRGLARHSAATLGNSGPTWCAPRCTCCCRCRSSWRWRWSARAWCRTWTRTSKRKPCRRSSTRPRGWTRRASP